MASRIRMLCMIQENALEKALIGRLESSARLLYSKHFGAGFKITSVWISIPKGQAYIAGKPSQASTVTLSVAENTTNEIRHAFMADFCQMWMDITGCHENEIILSVMDQSLSDEYAQRSIQRINSKTRFYHIAKLLLKLVRSKLSKGYLSINLNFDR